VSWIATTGGISGEMIRDLMLESVEKRFGSPQNVPHDIEWLSDNGSCYHAHETIALAKSIRRKQCFTPVRSSKSNGMAEPFIKTFKRN
jgi:putative transposase